MRPIRTILVAVKDPTARTLPAVTKAAQLAIALGARVELFHAISDAVMIDALTAAGTDTRKFEREARAATIKQLEVIAARLRRHDIAVDTHAEWDHPPHEAIIRRAERSRADLVVAERHAGAHRAKWLLSYTDWEVLRQCGAPVLLVKSGKPYHRPAILAAVDPGHSHDKPAALDASIVHWAQELRSALSGKLNLLHAFSPPIVFDAGIAAGASARIPVDLVTGAQRDARRRLDELAQTLQAGASTRHVVNAPAAQALLQVATSTRAQIVVMGAVSRSGLKRLFIGNTAESVIDSLKADVLVVKPRSFKVTVPRTVRGMSIVTAPTPMF